MKKELKPGHFEVRLFSAPWDKGSPGPDHPELIKMKVHSSICTRDPLFIKSLRPELSFFLFIFFRPELS